MSKSIRALLKKKAAFRLFFAGLCFLCGKAAASDAVLPETPFVPAVLSASDAEKYAEIFSLLDEDAVSDALKLNKTVDSPLLNGYVSAAAYMSPATGAPSKKEAETWLSKYRHLPVAPLFYEYLMRKSVPVVMKRPDDKAAALSSGACTSMHIPDPMDYVFFKKASYVPEPYRQQVRRSMAFFSASLRHGKTLAAKLHLNDATVVKHLSRKDMDESLTALAFAYFIDGEDEKAWKTVLPVLERNGDTGMPLASWTAGLVAWRKGDYPNAARYFKATADSQKTSDVLKAQAAYWATRAFIKNDDFADVLPYLQTAADASPHSFYGILAQRALGWEIGHAWKRSKKDDADAEKIVQTDGGKKALAFLQIGRTEEAERELISLYASNPSLRSAVLAFADTLTEMPELPARLTGLTGEIETQSGKKALYPFPSWTPLKGWRVDKALVYGFIRQESCFKNKAFSKAGARGVMQLMPGTAKLMSKKLGEPYRLSKLHRIPYNLMIGQELIATLLNHPRVNGNLFMAVAAYNCGTRNLKKWSEREDFQNDPLLFVEGIPSRETRGFVKKVMANYWVYRSLFGKDLKSVDDVLAGRFPMYKED